MQGGVAENRGAGVSLLAVSTTAGEMHLSRNFTSKTFKLVLMRIKLPRLMRFSASLAQLLMPLR